MSDGTFRLIPFPAQAIPAISISGTFSLEDHSLTVHYSLSGNTEQVLLPPASRNPSRRDELWKETCFEFFLAVKAQPGYWEFNLSPSGDWNAYRMDAYRRIGFREEKRISHLPLEFRKALDEYALDVSVDLLPLIEPQFELQMSVTAIIQSKDGSETYWAPVHPGPYADFHLRDGFIFPLATQTHPLGRLALDG